MPASLLPAAEPLRGIHAQAQRKSIIVETLDRVSEPDLQSFERQIVQDLPPPERSPIDIGQSCFIANFVPVSPYGGDLASHDVHRLVRRTWRHGGVRHFE